MWVCEGCVSEEYVKGVCVRVCVCESVWGVCASV